MKFTLPDLNYKEDELEPYIDAETMKIHRTKHHQTYINNLNSIIESDSKLSDQSLLDLLTGIYQSTNHPSIVSTGLINNGGGHYNHSMFWAVMGTNSSVDDIGSLLMHNIKKSFDNFEDFQQKFTQAALGLFGSGWVWLCYSINDSSLVIEKTSNQDTPLMYDKNLVPIVCLDVWEHAYYLKYQNLRVNYVKAWWNVVNWKLVDYLYLNFAVKGRYVPIKDNGVVGE